MKTKKVRKLFREKEYVLEVEVTAIDDGKEDDPWSPSYSAVDAQRLYDAAMAMKAHDWNTARRFGHLFHLEPVAA